MARSLVDEFSSLLTPELLQRASGAYGESPERIGKALGVAAPVLLAGALAKANDPGGAQDLLGFLRDPAVSPNLLANLGALFGSDAGGPALSGLVARFLASLFGGRTDAVRDAILPASGVDSRTLSALLPVAAAIVLGLLGSKVRSERLDASGLTKLLLGQRNAILAALPAGVGSVLNLSQLRNLGAPAAGSAAAARRLWIWPVAIALLLGLWWLLRGSEPGRAPVPPIATAPRQEVLPPVAAPAPSAAIFERRLPSGFTLRSPEIGIERQLVLFIEDPSRSAEVDTWFNFDRLLFETGSATLMPESREQLRNVAEILKAYPDTRVKIGGYTDNTGDPAANLKLSQDRAASVVAELVGLGVAPSRLEAEGYGEQHPVATNATESGRAQNRRIALRVTDK